MDERGRRVNKPVKGEAHYSAKLTTEKVHEIRRLGIIKMSIKKIAERFGVSESTVTAILRGRTWKDV